jgi:hypothetical protein
VPTWALAAGVAVIALLWLVIRREYGSRYGSVRPSPRQQTRDALALVLACAIVVGVSVLLRDLPVNAIAIGFAVAMALGYALGPGLRPHHVAILGALLVAGALPVWDGADSANSGLLLAGIAVALTGVFDHRAFLHTFGPSADAGLISRSTGSSTNRAAWRSSRSSPRRAMRTSSSCSARPG